jgi:hypothetical protein
MTFIDWSRLRLPQGQPIRLQPLIEHVAHQPAAQCEPGGVVEPHLTDVEQQQYGCQLGEHAELAQKCREILAGQRVQLIS